MMFYIGRKEFSPEQFILINKYSNVIKLKNLEDFIRIANPQ